MGRPRVGNGSTFIRLGNGGGEWLIFTDRGKWALTGDASGWPRCEHCRRPYEVAPFGFPVCCTCFFYGGGLADTDEFWRLTKEKHPLAGYVIGDGFTRSMGCGFLLYLSRHVSTLRDLRFTLSQQPDWVNQHWNGAPPRLGPLVLASGTLTEGGDVKQAPGESLSGPTAESGDAQPTPVSDPISNKGER